jgi:hypothetical protein
LSRRSKQAKVSALVSHNRITGSIPVFHGPNEKKQPYWIRWRR